MTKQDTGLGQETATLGRLRQGHAFKLHSARALIQPVVHRYGTVYHGEVGIEKVQCAHPLAKHFSKEVFGLFANRRLEVVIPVRIKLGVHCHAIHRTDIEPLIDKLIHKVPGALIIQHGGHGAFNLALLLQLPLLCCGEQTFIRHGSPEEIGEARRNLPVIQRTLFFPAGLHEIKEIRRD